jgi:ADP-heptose:LPS heptosyltransferase
MFSFSASGDAAIASRTNCPAIVVFRVGLLGDTVACLPAIAAIRRRHPHHRLILLTAPPTDPSWVSAWTVFEKTGWFDEAIFYDPRMGPARNLARIAAIAARLRGARIEHAFCLAPLRTRGQALRDRFFFRELVGAKAYHAAAPMARSYREEALAAAPCEAEGLRLLKVVDAGALQDEVDRFRLAIPPADRRAAACALLEAGIAPDARIIAVAPGSRTLAKRWPEESFERVGAALLARFEGLSLVTIGGEEDRALCQRLCAAWGVRARNVAGMLSIYGSAAVLERSLLYVGNDSGPMHLAASVGTPCVAIFSAREAVGRWRPAGEGHTVLRTNPPCAGCMLDECIEEDARCLRDIPVGTVVAAIERRIRHSATVDPRSAVANSVPRWADTSALAAPSEIVLRRELSRRKTR